MIGPTQRHVLLVFSTRGECARTDWDAWYPLTTNQASAAIDRLGRRGLVDVAGFKRGHDGREVRTFQLTEAGHAEVDKIAPFDPDDS